MWWLLHDRFALIHTWKQTFKFELECEHTILCFFVSSPEPKAHKVSLYYTNGPSSVRRRRRPSVVVHAFKLDYLWSELANLDQILCVASLG